MSKLPLILLGALMTQGCIPVLATAIAGATMAGIERPEECESCKADALMADHLEEVIPEWIEESRARAGATATADRTGYYSWEISLSGHPVSKCGVRARSGWQCDPLSRPPLWQPL